MTVRCSFHCPPRLPLPGSSGAITAHAASVNSPRPGILLHLPDQRSDLQASNRTLDSPDTP
jgi:hypothetical protein